MAEGSGELELLLDFGDGGSRKELIVEYENAIEKIEVEASEHFQVKVLLYDLSAGGPAAHILQRWSSKWSEFVDVMSLEDIKTKDKLRVVPKSAVSALCVVHNNSLLYFFFCCYISPKEVLLKLSLCAPKWLSRKKSMLSIWQLYFQVQFAHNQVVC